MNVLSTPVYGEISQNFDKNIMSLKISDFWDKIQLINNNKSV